MYDNTVFKAVYGPVFLKIMLRNNNDKHCWVTDKQLVIRTMTANRSTY